MTRRTFDPKVVTRFHVVHGRQSDGTGRNQCSISPPVSTKSCSGPAPSSSPDSLRVSIMHGPLYGPAPVPKVFTWAHDPVGESRRKWRRLLPDAHT